MNFIIRGDDLNYSRGVNYSINDATKTGYLKGVGCMVNISEILHGANPLKNLDIALGLHVNISAGSPLTLVKNVSSLVNQEGQFHASKYYRTTPTDVVDVTETFSEIEAQYKQFLALFGRNPDYIDGHGVRVVKIPI